jgi:hypothetical protein
VFDATGVRELPFQLEKLLGSPERVGVINSKGE